MKKLSTNIFQLDLGKANVFLIKAKDGLTLVDTEVVGAKARLEKKLAKNGFKLNDISRILVTHAHIDHVGGLKELQAATGAEVWAHRLDAPTIRGEAEVPLPDPDAVSWQDRLIGNVIAQFVGEQQPAAPVHRELEDSETLDEVLPGLRTVHLPGHSLGQVGFWLESERLLIGGDVMMHLTPWLTRPLGAYTPDMAEAHRSILKVAGLGVRTLGVGHGPALVGNADAAVNRLARKIKRQQRSSLTKRV